jgi:hypothetical protein
MREFLSFSITKLIFLTAFLFALNQNFFLHLPVSVQNNRAEYSLNQANTKHVKNDVINRNLIETSIFGLDISISKSITFQIKLGGQLQLTLDTGL